MSSDDSFEDRLKAFAEQIAKSLTSDIDEVAQRLGVDPDRARDVASTLERWLGDRFSDQEPHIVDQSDVPAPPRRTAPTTTFGAGPHPLDLPTPEQGIALSALDSGRFTVRAGSSELAATGADADLHVGERTDLVNDLRARDWVTPDGTLTMVGRQALLRWCRTAENSTEPPQTPIT
jgi:hypothetical protein